MLDEAENVGDAVSEHVGVCHFAIKTNAITCLSELHVALMGFYLTMVACFLHIFPLIRFLSKWKNSHRSDAIMTITASNRPYTHDQIIMSLQL